MKRLKIAIFSGVIPSTTFIEHLIEGVAETHKVLLFGVVNTRKHYASKHVKIYSTPKSHIVNLVFTVYRLLLLLLSRPRAAYLLFKEVSSYTRLYDRWIWFSKFLPIVLYRPDVLHLQWARDIEFYAFLQDVFHIPIVVSFRGAHINYTPILQPEVAAIYKRTFPKLRAFHAVSEAIAVEAQQYGASSECIRVIHSPLNFKALHFKRAPIHFGATLRLLSVGRFHWKKGYRYALSALSLLKQQGVNVEYTIVSSNAINEELLFQIHQEGLEDSVTIKSGLSQDDLFRFMSRFDVMLLPSLEEGIANVVLEAMALGVPVISTDCGGMREVVKPGETGWLVPVRDAEALANAVVDVMQTDAQVLERIVQQAHDFVKAEFAAEDSIGQFLELYEGVCGFKVES